MLPEFFLSTIKEKTMSALFSRVCRGSAILGLLLLVAGTSEGAYVPPPGIPAPPFGINETAKAPPASWPAAATAGYYYVDNSHPSSTDTANTYGTPNLPRKTLPTTLPAGAYLEVHGGPYVSSKLIVTCNGDAANPVVVHGSPTAMPEFQASLAPAGGYAIFENLRFSGNGTGVNLSTAGVHHVAIRNCEFVGSSVSAGNNSVIYTGGTSTARGKFFVIYNNVIRDYGDKSRTVAENDYHGVLPGAYSDNVWVLSNDVYNLGGDGVQVGQATLTADERPNFVYVGGNSFHDNRENAVDVKRVNDLIVSWNDCYNFLESTSSSGEAIVIHNEAARVWVIGNRVHDSNLGIVTTGSSQTNFIGNLIYNINHNGVFSPTNLYSLGAAIHIRGALDDSYVVGNTIDNCAVGIQVPLNVVHLYNNIFSNRAEPLGRDVFYGTGAGSQFDSNLFYGGKNITRIAWGESVDRTLAGFRAQFPTLGVNCPPEGDPQYVNPGSHDYRILASSPARDRGIPPVPYESFVGIYGTTASKDMAGVPRPSGNAWDIGAYEVQLLAAAPVAPKAPEGLRVQ